MSNELTKHLVSNIESKIHKVKLFEVTEKDKTMVEDYGRAALLNVAILINAGRVKYENKPMIDIQGVFLRASLILKIRMLDRLWEQDKLNYALANDFSVFSKRLKEVMRDTNKPGFIAIYVIDSITHDEIIINEEDIEFLKGNQS